MACRRVIIVGERVVKDFIGALVFTFSFLVDWNVFMARTGSDSSESGSAEKIAVPGMVPTPNNTPRKETEKERKNK
jgi:hypothetical protein